MSGKAAYQPPRPVVYPSLDWQLEEFLASLRASGHLASLRALARARAEKRRLAVAKAERDAAVAAASGNTSNRRRGSEGEEEEEEEEEEEGGGFESERDEWERWTHRHAEGEEGEEEDASTSTDSEWLDCEPVDPGFHDVNGGARTPNAAAGTLAQWAMRLGGGGGARQRAGQDSGLVIGCDERGVGKDEQGLYSKGNSASAMNGGEEQVVTVADLHGFLQDLAVDDDDLAKAGWRQTLNRKTDRLSCRAWSRDPPGGGPTVYRCHMVIRECSAEAARDFFLDEDYRAEWDDTRAQGSQMLEEWDPQGECVARWVRKFPFFLRDREYVVARRVWSLRSHTYHCISKLTAHPSAPPRANFLRVSAFTSMWRVAAVTDAQQISAVWAPPQEKAQACLGKPAQSASNDGGRNGVCWRQAGGEERGKGKCVESRAAHGQADGGDAEEERECGCRGRAPAVEQACDIVTIHTEDSGVSRNIAKMGVARGMWSHVVKMEAAMHAYVKAGRNAKHLLPMFLLHADAMHAASGMRPL
ncbi:hypothetical protein CLOM_g23227 [Closterium sp. NIES-68]|nr:hypothetical protein CLOM_g23227 [Closterium sp. NIES-68]GJP58087.1 hypothetical protein CLOP_g20421 [Closterium sp. NIES-67]